MSDESAPKRIGSGRSGPVRKALRESIAEARRSKRIKSEHLVVAAMAELAAGLVDERAKAGDGAGMLKAMSELRGLMDSLPLRETAGGGEPSDGSGSGGGHLELLGSPPEVGDAAHS